MGPLSRWPGPLVETKGHRQTGDEALEGQGCPGRGQKGLPGETEMEGTSRSSEEGELGGRKGGDTRRRGLGEERAPGPAQGGCGSRRRELSDGEAEGAPHGDCGLGFLKKRRDKGPKPSAGVTGSW